MSPPEALSSSQYPSVPDIFAYSRANLPRVLSLTELLSVLPDGLQVPLGDLLQRVQLELDRNATEESVKDIIYAEGIAAGLQVIPSWSGDLTVGHTSKSRRMYLDIGTVISFRYCLLASPLNLGSKDSKEDCGNVIKWKACKTDGEHTKIPIIKHCDRLDCPICYTKVLAKAAGRVARTTEGYRSSTLDYIKKRTRKKGKAYDFRHFSFSPSESEWNRLMDKVYARIEKEGRMDDLFILKAPYFLQELRNAGHIWVEQSGLTAYVMVPHLFRIKKEYKEFCQNLADMKNKELPSWKPKYNRYTVLNGDPNIEEYLYFSPHVHVVAYGKTIPTPSWKALFPDVNLTNHSGQKSKENKILKTQTPEGAVRAIMYYLLTHASLVRNESGRVMDLYTYGGYLHSSKLKKSKVCPDCGEKNASSATNCKACGGELHRTVYATCPICGDILVYAYGPDPNNLQYPEKDEPVYRKETEFLYEFVKAPPGILPEFRVTYSEEWP